MISFRDPKRDLVPAFSEEKRPRSWLRNRQDDTRGLSSRSAPIRDLVLARPQTPHSRPIIVSSSLFISCSSDLCQQPGREASEPRTKLLALERTTALMLSKDGSMLLDDDQSLITSHVSSRSSPLPLFNNALRPIEREQIRIRGIYTAVSCRYYPDFFALL